MNADAILAFAVLLTFVVPAGAWCTLAAARVRRRRADHARAERALWQARHDHLRAVYEEGRRRFPGLYRDRTFEAFAAAESGEGRAACPWRCSSSFGREHATAAAHTRCTPDGKDAWSRVHVKCNPSGGLATNVVPVGAAFGEFVAS